MKKFIICNEQRYEENGVPVIIKGRDFSCLEDLYKNTRNIECEELSLYDTHSYFGFLETIKDIKFNSIKIVGKDLNVLIDFYYRNFINLEELKTNLYRDCTIMYACDEIVKHLKDLKYQIKSIKMDGINYYIEAKKE